MTFVCEGPNPTELFHETQTHDSEGPRVHEQFICAKTVILACLRCIDFTVNAQNDYRVSTVWLRFIRVCKYYEDFFCARTMPNCIEFLGTVFSVIWKSHSTVQSGIIGQHVISFNDVNLMTFLLGGREEVKVNKDYLK